MSFAIDLDLIPYEDHLCLVTLGKSADANRYTVYSDAYYFRCLLGSVARYDEVRLDAPLEARFDAAFFDFLVEEVVALESGDTMNMLRRMRALIQRFAPRSDTSHITFRMLELAAEAKQTGSEKRPTRARLSVTYVGLPAPHRELLKPFEVPEQLETCAAEQRLEHCHAESRWNAISRPVLRFYGALDRRGIDWRSAVPSALVTRELVAIYWDDIHNEDEPWHDAERLKDLRTSLRRIHKGSEFAFLDQIVAEASMRFQNPDRTDASRPRKLHPTIDDELFKSELKLLSDALGKDDLDREEGEPGDVRPGSIPKMHYVLRLLHDVLERRAPDLRRIPLADRDMVKAAKMFEEALEETCRPISIISNLSTLKTVLDRIRFPQGHSFINRRIGELRRQYKPDPNSVPPVPAHELKDLGMTMAKDARRRIDDLRDCRFPYRSLCGLAIRYRNGLMIALLSTLPLRLRSLTAIALSIYLVKTEIGYAIFLPGELTKSGEEFYADLPTDIAELVHDFLSDKLEPTKDGISCSIRQLIAPKSKSQALWLSRDGGALDRGSIKKIVPEVVLAATGIRVSCHKFRRIVATDSLDQDATDFDIGKVKLHHKDWKTTRRYYEDFERFKKVFAKMPTVLNDRAQELLQF